MAELGIIKVIGTEGVCNTVANAFNSNTLIKLTNIDTAAHLITFAFANSTAYGTVTMLANTELYVQKAPTDLLSSNAATAVVLAGFVRKGTY